MLILNFAFIKRKAIVSKDCKQTYNVRKNADIITFLHYMITTIRLDLKDKKKHKGRSQLMLFVIHYVFLFFNFQELFVTAKKDLVTFKLL